MIRQIILGLGLGALSITSTSVALASPAPKDSNQRIYINGERYLSNLENRSVAKDFGTFFAEDSQTRTLNYPQGTIQNSSQTEREIPLLDKIRVEIGDDSPNNNVDIFPNSRNGDRSGESQILYQFEEW